MTVVVAGMWELGWNTPIKEVDLWEMVVRDFSVDVFHMSPVSGITSACVQERPSINDVVAEHSDLTLVIVDESGTESLATFQHPESCLYLFGKTNCSAANLISPKPRTLHIETVKNDSLLWAHQACAIVLYDRLAKSWR